MTFCHKYSYGIGFELSLEKSLIKTKFMNLLKRKTPVYTSLFDDLLYNQNFANHDSFIPAVNIIDAEEYFDIQLAVPGKEEI